MADEEYFERREREARSIDCSTEDTSPESNHPNFDKTICARLDAISKDVTKAVAENDTIDVTLLLKRLHEVRKLANRMEAGLKLRKEMMEYEGIENEYQEKKKIDAKPTGINKYPEPGEEKVSLKTRFHVTVKQDGEVVYDNKLVGMAMCAVEKITDVDNEGVITGITQNFLIGHDLVAFYALDQLKQYTEAKGVELLMKMQAIMVSGGFSVAEAREKIIKSINDE